MTEITGIVKLNKGDLIRVNKNKIYIVGEHSLEFVSVLPCKSGDKVYTWQDVKEVYAVNIKDRRIDNVSK